MKPREPAAGVGALIAILSAWMGAATAASTTTPLPQLLPLPGPIPVPSAPTPAPPPINPGYAVTPPGGLSPILTQPGPVYLLPEPPNPSYPALPLPGPIDQQKLQSYRNDLRAQQLQLQRQGVSPATERALEIQRQLNAPDPQ